MSKNTTTLESVIEVNSNQMTIRAWLKSYAKENSFKSLKTERVELSPNKLAELLFDYAISGKELDEDLTQYTDHIAIIAATVADCVLKPKSKTEIKEEKDAADKAAADLKEQEEKFAASHALMLKEEFASSMSKGADSTVSITKDFLEGIRATFPETISIKPNGEVIVSPEASREDIGLAFGAAIQFSQASEATGNMLVFAIGELTNASVTSGVYESKKACAEDISMRLSEAKGKSYSVKTIENFARVAERISPELRNEAVPATIYHHIANVKQPKAQEGESEAKFTKRKAKYDSQIKEIIQSVADGAIEDVKGVKLAIDNLQKSSGLKSESCYTIGDYTKIFVEATIMMKYAAKDGTLFIVGDQSVAVSRSEMKQLADSALAHITNMKNIDPKGDLYLSGLLAGYKSVTLDAATVEA